jgi:hypothetical protein
MSRHTATHSHLNRFQIIESPLCIRLENYETVDHLIWDCPRFVLKRTRIISQIPNIEQRTPIRDCCAKESWRRLKKCILTFFLKMSPLYFSSREGLRIGRDSVFIEDEIVETSGLGFSM